MKRFDYTSPDGNASDAQSVPTHEFRFNDTFTDQYNSETAVLVSGKYSDSPNENETVVWECRVECLDWCDESPEIIREIVSDLVKAHLSASRVTFEQTIEIV